MSIQAVANGPIAFTDAIKGEFVLVPITALKFTAGVIDASSWPSYATYQAQLDPWLKYLARIGAITPGKANAPQPAMLIEAVAEGLPGNGVKVEFSNITVVDPNDSAQTTFDAKITEKQEYPGLKPDTVKSVIGTEVQRGTQPGLVTILDADTPVLPAAGVYPLAGGGDGAKSKTDINKSSGAGKAFTIEARSDGLAGDTIQVTITDVDTIANTFTLKTAYEQSITGLKIGDLPQKLAGAPGKEFVIKVSQPAGGSFGVPAPGLAALTGGAEKADATHAAATIFTAV